MLCESKQVSDLCRFGGKSQCLERKASTEARASISRYLCVIHTVWASEAGVPFSFLENCFFLVKSIPVSRVFAGSGLGRAVPTQTEAVCEWGADRNSVLPCSVSFFCQLQIFSAYGDEGIY